MDVFWYMQQWLIKDRENSLRYATKLQMKVSIIIIASSVLISEQKISVLYHFKEPVCTKVQQQVIFSTYRNNLHNNNSLSAYLQFC